MSKSLKTISVIFLVSASIVMHSQPGMSWSLIWSEEFSGDTLNTSHWSYELGDSGWGNNEWQNYTADTSNVKVSGGTLKITARNENGQYTSARVITKDQFSFTYGKIEARMKLPMGQGLWPAFWMMGNNISEVGWPSCGEIDVMEHINNETLTHGTVHWNNNGHVWESSSTHVDPTQYHIYGAVWTEDTISFYVDGVVYHDYSISDNPNTDAFHQPFFLLLNMAVGGNWPGNPDNTTPFPSTMEVDFVRVYQSQSTNLPEVEDFSISCYPNPFDATLRMNLINRNNSVQIFTTQGQLIYSANQCPEQHTIPTIDWKSGLYVVHIRQGEVVTTHRIVK